MQRQTPEGMNHLVVSDVKMAPLLSGQPGKVYFVFGYGYEKNVNANYGPNDYWYSGGGLTNCGCGPNNGAQGLCADKQIEARIDMPIPLPNVRCFFTSILSIAVGPISGGGIYYGYELFQTGIPETPYKMYNCCCGPITCDPCFSPTLMSFYTQGTWNVFQQLKPAGTQTINAKVEWVWSLGGDEAGYMHAGLFRYGKVNCRN